MINGDKTYESSSKVVSHDPLEGIHLPLQSQYFDNGDESPAHSQLSSCGDSEFERYCSANSVMGTPSLCGSVGTFQECGDSDFGSSRSYGLGEISSSFENFRLEGEFAKNFREKRLSSSSGSVGFSGRKSEGCEGKNSINVRNAIDGRGLMGRQNGISSCDEFKNWNSNLCSSKLKSESELPSVMDLSTIVDEELCSHYDCGGIVRYGAHCDLARQQSSVGTVAVQQAVNIDSAQRVERRLDEAGLHSDEESERDERERYSDDEKNSSRYEHSEGEDSMFGYGTDDDQKMEFFNQKNVQYYQEARGEKGNSLLMSSTLAFGLDDWDDFELEARPSDTTSVILEKGHLSFEHEKEVLRSFPQNATAVPVGESMQEEVKGVSVFSDQVQGADEQLVCSKATSFTPVDFVDIVETKHSKGAENMLAANNDTGDIDELADYLENQTGSNIFSIESNPLSQSLPLKDDLDPVGGNLSESSGVLSTRELSCIGLNRFLNSQELNNSTSELDPLVDDTACRIRPVPILTNKDPSVDFLDKACLPVTSIKSDTKRSLLDSPSSVEHFTSHQKIVKTDNVELDDFCNELVHEMEEILLDSSESSGARLTHGDLTYQAHSPLPSRDGGSTASTSSADYVYPLNKLTQRIDGIEVVGAKQKKGDVSFSERLVGVKEYTVYVIRVWSGKDHWEVERRYRDFCTLHRRLKTLFTTQGYILPFPWSSIERESRKIFGNVSPDVVNERSALIQECLRSIISHPYPSSLSSALYWFLSPPKFVPSSPSSGTHESQSPFSGRVTSTDNVVTFGKTISLIVEIQPYKSVKQILEAQHFTCAGCHKHFDDGKTRVLEFVQTLGWGKPRLCGYSGQLFCSTCHTNELAVLPARVLHYWDFTQYPVSQIAKSYLDSIHDKPMLCVSAVNPFLFSKVPALQQVTCVRKRIGIMLPYIRCPFRMSITKGLASRRYLLESNDFFALKDLIDLSKGAFAALPMMVDTVSRKILEHITDQCLICCDVGIPCNARQACNDPSALIFAFQEGEIERCRSCKSGFHKPCFKKIPNCPCGEPLKLDREKGISKHKSNAELNSSSTLELFRRKSDSKSTVGFLSGFFTKAGYEKLWGPKEGDTVISMGSLPSTSL